MKQSGVTGVPKVLRDNALSLSLGSLFVVCLVAQSLTGLSLYNGDQSSHALPALSWSHYLRTGNFLSGIFLNWQAALLQLASLILFGVFLRQRGAPHSRQSPNAGGSPEKESRKLGWLHANSLTIFFIVTFVVAFVLHFLAGMADYNHERSLTREEPLTYAGYATSAKFWFLTFQCWQAEYFAIALYVFVSVFLRQAGSPESKPADASDDETGEGDTK